MPQRVGKPPQFIFGLDFCSVDSSTLQKKCNPDEMMDVGTQKNIKERIGWITHFIYLSILALS